MRRHHARKRILGRDQRGSALLVTLMVMVGLSLLGLGFVAISETENTISANERNYAQTLSIAETGARTVVEWFQDPKWARSQNLMPANTTAIKNVRTCDATASAPYTGYTGRYKDTAGTLLFDKPYKPAVTDRFLGTETNPDILINGTTAAAFLTDFNNAILNDTTDGQVTEIKIYAPPIDGGGLSAAGFWQSGTRFGLCTIKVTAQKFIGPTPVATRSVKLVISEWPFPGPQGPVQSNANISTGGNFGVHWGKMTSEKTMEIKRPLVGLPWNDPWDRIHFEHGYWAGCGTSAGCSASPIAAVSGPGFDDKLNPNTPGSFCDGADWLYKLSEVQFEDPWYEARAKTQITNAILSGALATTPQPFKFNNAANNITANGPSDYSGYSNWFQLQNNDDPATTCGARDHKLVIFPKIDYNFWKSLSQAATTTVSGVHYLRWVSGENYTDGVTTKSFAKWVNTARATSPAKSGFYFFDTQNGLNPQGAAPPGTLAPPVEVNSSDDGSVFKMMGFIYLNTQVFGTTGIRGPDSWYNFPGEPFRDIGYKPVCDTSVPEQQTQPGGIADHYCTTILPQGSNNGQFDGQDLNNNGVYDVYLAQRTVTDPSGTRTLTNEWYPVPWFPGCTPGFNNVAGANCSEPQEPFLNLIYPATACCSGGGAPSLLTVGWQDPSSYTRISKVKDKLGTAGVPKACSASLLIAPTDPAGGPLPGPNVPDKNCTSNAYDRDGSLTLNLDAQPIMDGVLYNEGNYDTEGNATYFGSILIQGDIIGTGNPSVWFDEYLIKGGWQDKFTDLPRVYITSDQTDQ